jgi:hypothetical protein
MKSYPVAAIGMMAVLAASLSHARAESRPTVVELFTSQGCSSCPPAEALLGDLAKRGDVLALAFHVDYWDNLGWKDHYSLKTATSRQNDYAAEMGLGYIYTPQMVIDGTTQLVGSDRGSVMAALSHPRPNSIPVALVRKGPDISVEVGPAAADQPPASGDLVLVSYESGAATHVASGENAGRTIAQVNIVRSIRKLGRWTGTALHLDVPASAIPEGSTNLALLLQQPGPGAILGAASLSLN